MAKLQVLVLLSVLLCGVLADTEQTEKDLDAETIENVMRNGGNLQKDNARTEQSDDDKFVEDELEEEIEQNDQTKDAVEQKEKSEIPQIKQEDPIFGFIGKFISGVVHTVAKVGTAILGFAAGAIGGAVEGIGKLIDGTISGAIKGAIHHSGAGLSGKYAKTGWNHPVEVKNNGKCNSVSEKLCQRMAENNNKKNPKLNRNGLRYVAGKIAYKNPKGCFTFRDQFYYNSHYTEGKCTRTKVCMCEVCARKTTGERIGKTGRGPSCCHLPFQYEGKLYGDCTTKGCWNIFGNCRPWCAVVDVMDGGNKHMWDRCKYSKKDANSVEDAPSPKAALFKKIAHDVQSEIEERAIEAPSKDDIEADWNDAEEPREKLI